MRELPLKEWAKRIRDHGPPLTIACHGALTLIHYLHYHGISYKHKYVYRCNVIEFRGIGG
jgi:hypothetical protein